MIEKCLAILKNIAGNHGMNSLSTISAETGIPRSTVHRLLKTMEENEMVLQQRQGGYIISEQLLRICIQGTANDHILNVLIPLVDDIRDETHETISVNVISGMERMCIYRAEGDHIITRMVQIGNRSPLFVGASGRMLAAGLRQNKLERAMDYALQNGYAQQQDIARLMDQVQKDRQRGYAVSIEERHAGCGSISVPIKRSITGETVATISISALASRVENMNTQKKYLSLLMRAAAEANAKILM